MQDILRFLRFAVSGFRTRISLIMLIDLLGVAASLVFVWYSKVTIDIATGEVEGNLLYYSIALVALIAVQILLRAFDIRLRRMTEVRMGNSIRYNVFSRLLYTRWQELSKLHSGDTLTRMIKDTDDLIGLLVTSLPTAVVAVVQFVGAVVILYILDPVLALILGVGMPLITIFGRLYYMYMRKYTHEVKESESMITSMVEESLLNQIVIRTFERQEDELKRLDGLQSQLHTSVEKRTRVSVFANILMGTTFNGGYITAFLWSVYGLARRVISFGTVTAYLQLVSRIQRPLFDLMRLLPSMVSAKTAVERLIYITDFSLEDTKNKILLEGDVKLKIEDMSFGYASDAKPVFDGFSMEVDSGTMVAITGETGVGKTTLLRLLLALVRPDLGSITLNDGNRTVEVSERTRTNFVYVPQGGSLFSGTIRDNLLLGDASANDVQLRHALMTASAGFVFDLPNGLDTELGEGGAGLSEGQAQRIAIARAMLRPGRILLLDEATSALDPDTEQRFMHNLRREMGNRAIIFITHQPEVAAFCDKRYHLGG